MQTIMCTFVQKCQKMFMTLMATDNLP